MPKVETRKTNRRSSNDYAKSVINLRTDAFAKLIAEADAFICAAGFESRAERVPLRADVSKNPIVVGYKNGPRDNDKTLNKFVPKFRKIPGFDVCELDFAHVEKFESNFEETLKGLKNLESGEIVLDISGLPNFAICIAVMKIRHIFPAFKLTLLYTEAEEYFPRKVDFNRIRHAASKKESSRFPEYLSSSAVSMYWPSMFSGVALGHHNTCLIVFAGYEPHRSNCVIEATNPSKLVMVYGEPARADLKWRLELSRIMHRGIDDQLMKTEEVRSTSEVGDNLKLLLEYYDYLYDDHVLCVSPANSKIQAIAAALAWETYPDIQLNFPVPAEYLPTKFSVEARDTFQIPLGISPGAKRFFDPEP